jgi:hypothetical protein
MADAFPFPRAGRAWDWAALVALAIALGAGCASPFLGTTATSFLKRVRESKDPNIRYYAYAKLASPTCYEDEAQKMVAVGVLGKALISEREPQATKAVICRTLGVLGKVEARPALLRAASDPDEVVRAEAYRALGSVGLSEDAVFLAQKTVTDTSGDCRLAAIDALGSLKSRDTRILVLLVQGMEDDDPAIRLSSVRALRTITGKDLGVEATPWRDFVEEEIKQKDGEQQDGKKQDGKKRGGKQRDSKKKEDSPKPDSKQENSKGKQQGSNKPDAPAAKIEDSPSKPAQQ